MTVNEYLARTRLVEEPRHVTGKRYYIWHMRRVVWRGYSRAAGERWARWAGIAIDEYDPCDWEIAA